MNHLLYPEKNFQAQLASTYVLASCAFLLVGDYVYPAHLGWMDASVGEIIRGIHANND